MENVSPIDCFAPEAQEFETDGIHLTEESGAIFVGSLQSKSEEFFNFRSVTNEELGIEPYGFNYDWNNDQDESMEQEGTSPNQTGIRIGTQFGNQTPAPDCVIPTTKKHVDLSAVESRIGTLEKNH